MAIETEDGITIHTPIEAPVISTTKGERTWTNDEVEAIRKQEKDKLYSRIESESSRVKSLEDQLQAIQADRDRTLADHESKIKAEQEKLREREREEFSAKDLLTRQQVEWEQRLNTVQNEWEQKLATVEADRQAKEILLEKEREFQAIEAYRQRRMHDEAENIVPQLLDLVAGNSQEEIENSIALLVSKSSAIINEVTQASPQSRLRGVPSVAPSSGPMDNYTEQKNFSVDDLRNMSMKEFAENRDRLLAAARPNRGR